MAKVKEKATEAAGAEEMEKVVNNTAEQEKAQNGAENEATEGKEAGAGTETGGKDAGETVRLAYIGPTLPSGQLKCNRIFIGTKEEIEKELEKVLEKYPLVKKLLVPVNQMGDKKDKAKTAGNILHKYYADLVSSIAGAAAKEG